MPIITDKLDMFWRQHVRLLRFFFFSFLHITLHISCILCQLQTESKVNMDVTNSGNITTVAARHHTCNVRSHMLNLYSKHKNILECYPFHLHEAKQCHGHLVIRFSQIQ